jgi:hypothetical protein
MLLGKLKTNKKMAKLQNTKPNFFKRMFMDDNDINEKSIVGFCAFLVMCIAFGVDIYTGIKGMPFEINEFIFDGFMVITLGAFGIASVDKYITGKKGGSSSDDETPVE